LSRRILGSDPRIRASGISVGIRKCERQRFCAEGTALMRKSMSKIEKFAPNFAGGMNTLSDEIANLRA
jgi:hypothetical protein